MHCPSKKFNILRGCLCYGGNSNICVLLFVNLLSNALPSLAVQIIPASVQPSTPTTIKVINSSAKAAKVQRAPRISGEDRSSPGNRTGIFFIKANILIIILKKDNDFEVKGKCLCCQTFVKI